MNEPVRQHLVPRVYLKNFAKPKKSDWYADVYDKTTEKYFNANIKNICVINDFYTFDNLPSDKKRFLERYYGSHIESDFPSIYRTLTDPAILRTDETLKLKIISFVMSQFTRTSKLTNAVNNVFNRALTRGHQMLDPNGPEQIIEFEGGGTLDFKDRTLKDVLKESDNDTRMQVNVKNFETFYDLVQRRKNDIVSVKKVHRKHFLITSDNPVVTSGFMFDPVTHFSMPLDENHILVLLPFQAEFAANNDMIFRTEMEEDMSYLQSLTSNTQQLDNAERYVIGSKMHLEESLHAMLNFDEEDYKLKSESLIERIKKASALLQAMKK